METIKVEQELIVMVVVMMCEDVVTMGANDVYKLPGNSEE